MSGTREAGLQAKAQFLARDPFYYQKLGALGGQWKGKKGFALMPKERLIELGRKGGTISRRRKKR